MDKQQVVTTETEQAPAANNPSPVQTDTPKETAAVRLANVLRGRFQTAEANAISNRRRMSDNDQAIGLAVDMYDTLVHNRAKFSREEGGDVYFQLPNAEPVLIGKSVIAGSINHGLNALFVDRGVAPDGNVARLATGFLQQLAYRASSREASLRIAQFSALSEDGKRLYVPQRQGMLGVSADGIVELSSESIDRILVKAAPEQKPFKFRKLMPEEIKDGLARFEKLIVDNLPTIHRPMRWFVAMQLALFPFVRQKYQDRLLMELKGSAGSGKSSGARRFARLHGFSELWGSVTDAALRNAGDVGIVFLDNQEQDDVSKVKNWLLFASTGADPKRSGRNGELRKTKSGRPIVVVTSIEGFDKTELRSRTVEVEFALTPEQISQHRPALEQNLQAIQADRDLIMSALMYVLVDFFAIEPSAQEDSPDRVARVGDNYVADCRLLRGFGRLAGKDSTWADREIKMWKGVLDAAGAIVNDELADIVRNFIDAKRATAPSGVDSLGGKPIGAELAKVRLSAPDLEIAHEVTFEGRAGTLYVTNFDAMKRWAAEQPAYRNVFPQNGEQFASRIREAQSYSLRVVKGKDSDRDGDLDHPLLKRKRHNGKQVRAIGFFVPDGD